MLSFEPVVAIAASRRVLLGREVRCDVDTGSPRHARCSCACAPRLADKGWAGILNDIVEDSKGAPDRYRLRCTRYCWLRLCVTVLVDHQPCHGDHGGAVAIPHALRAGVCGFAHLGSTLGSRYSRTWLDGRRDRGPASLVPRVRRQPNSGCRRSGDLGEHLRGDGRSTVPRRGCTGAGGCHRIPGTHPTSSRWSVPGWARRDVSLPVARCARRCSRSRHVESFSDSGTDAGWRVRICFPYRADPGNGSLDRPNRGGSSPTWPLALPDRRLAA
jgi:hypothetical protein